MQKFFENTKKRAFTLIELLVVLAVISIITFVLLVQQSKFDSATVMRGLVYNIALSVRQAQVYGVSVRESGQGSGTFAQGYGLYFNPGANPQSYVLFADVNNNGQYDVGEASTTFKISNTFHLSMVCALYYNGGSNPVSDCSNSGNINALTILFKRPNPDASFSTVPAIFGHQDKYTTAYIQVQATNGSTRAIHVYSTGQVSVDSIGQAI